MWFIIIAFVIFIIFIIINGVNTDRANQDTGTFTVHQTKDKDAKWLSATIRLLEDKVFIHGAYSYPKEYIPYSKITTVTLTQGEIQMRRSKKINIYYSFTLNYKYNNSLNNTFKCTSFSPLDNHKFKIIVQRINDKISCTEEALISKQLNVDDSLKANNDLCPENISLYTGSQIAEVSTIANTNDFKMCTVNTIEVMTKPAVNPIISFYNEVLEGKNTIDSMIDKYLEVTPMVLYYSETTINCLSTCIKNNTKTWLSNMILEKRVRNRILETKTETETNNTNVQSNESSINNDSKMSLMKYEGCNDTSTFARCNCGLFQRFDNKGVIIKPNNIKLVLQYRCKKCGETYNYINTKNKTYKTMEIPQKTDYEIVEEYLQNAKNNSNNINYETFISKEIECQEKDDLYLKIVNLLKTRERSYHINNQILHEKSSQTALQKQILKSTTHETKNLYIRLTRVINYIKEAKEQYPQELNIEVTEIENGNEQNTPDLNCVNLGLFKNGTDKTTKTSPSKKTDYDIVEGYLQKAKNKQTGDTKLDRKEDNKHEFNNLDELKIFIEDDIKSNPQKYVDMEELANVLIDEKTRCFCPQCHSEQTVIIIKNSTVKCLNCDEEYNADFTFNIHENDVIDDIQDHPQSAYLSEDYNYANKACEDEMNNCEVSSAVEIILDEENSISHNTSVPIPERVSNQELEEESGQSSNNGHKLNYVAKNDKLTSEWGSVPEIIFELTKDSSFESSEEQFYKQAKQWEDRWEKTNINVEFMHYTPTYQNMTDEQIKWYFTWRKMVRLGFYKNTSLSYIYLYFYELINQVGVENTADGLKKIVESWKQLRVFHKHLDRYLIKWVRDYIVYYGCEENYYDIILEVMKDEGYEIFCDEYLIMFFENKETSNLLKIINICSDYKILKSKFISAGYGEVMEKCFADVLIAVNADFIETTGKPLLEEFINMNQVYSWNPFHSAVFYKGNKSCIDKRRFINKYMSYWSENNRFYTSYRDYNAWYRVPKLKCFVADLLKCAETHLRFLLGFKGRLKFDGLPIEIQLLVQKAVQANYFKYHSSGKMYDESNLKLAVQKSSDYQIEAKKREFVIDVSKLDVLRKESDEIRDKLIIEQNTEVEVGMNKTLIENHMTNRATEIKDEKPSNEWLKFVSSLDIYQKEALNVILCKKNVNEHISSIAQKKLVMKEMLIESINEAAFEYIGDNLIDTNDSIPCVYDDYMDNILTVINTEV